MAKLDAPRSRRETLRGESVRRGRIIWNSQKDRILIIFSRLLDEIRHIDI